MGLTDHDPLDAVGRLSAMREAIAQRARDCGRSPDSVKLVAVSKTFSADDVWPTIADRRAGAVRRKPSPGSDPQMASISARAQPISARGSNFT